MMRKKIGIFAVVMTVMIFAGVRAQAAASYTMTCDAATQGKFTIALSSFSTGLTEGTSPQTGSRRQSYTLTVHFEPNAAYSILSLAIERNELIHSCILTESTSSANGKPAQEFTWEFKTGALSSVSAMGGNGVSANGTQGTPEGSMSAVFSFQEVVFASKGGLTSGGSVVKR